MDKNILYWNIEWSKMLCIKLKVMFLHPRLCYIMMCSVFSLHCGKAGNIQTVKRFSVYTGVVILMLVNFRVLHTSMEKAQLWCILGEVSSLNDKQYTHTDTHTYTHTCTHARTHTYT